MRFHLRRKPDGRPGRRNSSGPADSTSGTDGTCEAADDGIDLDRWVQAGADAALDATSSDEPDPLPTGDGSSLRDKLLAVLAEEEGSLVPSSAGDMTQSEWDSLSDIEREGFRRLQLKQLDPRLVPRYTMGTSRSGSRSARVYR
jgi:hypothetical protein